MVITKIQSDVAPRLICLVTDGEPSQEELTEAALNWSNYPLFQDTPFVVLMKAENLTDRAKELLRIIKYPGFVE